MKKLKKGFTLVELLITITIMGVMSSILLVSYKDYVSESKQAALKQEMSQLAQVYELGCVNGDFDPTSTSVTFETLGDAYAAVTNNTLGYSESELSFSNKKLTLTKNGYTATYDFGTKTISVA